MTALALLSTALRATGNAVLLVAAAAALWLVSRPIYNYLFHPLRKYPGPLLWRISPFPRAAAMCRGTLAFDVAEMQKKYGPVIRIGPSELAFASTEAWRDIYGHRAGGGEENPKDMRFYRVSSVLPNSIATASRADHSVLRRSMAHGFSDRSLREQEPIIGGYVDLLMAKLRSNCDNGSKPLNMREWYNWATFDIIGNLGFGSDFQCLENTSYTPWIEMITRSIKEGAYLNGVTYVGLRWLSKAVINIAMASFQSHQKLTLAKVQQRIEVGKKGERPDFIEGLIKQNLPLPELASNASSLIIAGSETTATLLTGATYFLVTNPEALKRLSHEVRSTFQTEKDITLLSVQNLTYMQACLNEALRMYPPVAIGLPRLAARGGTTVAGNPVPQGTQIAVWQWAINYSQQYWAEADSFHPERWMGEDERFANDTRDAMQPFAVGPRNCIGKNLAYAEMRLILARVIFNFDMHLAEDSRSWLETQKCHILWDKPSLNVHLKPVAV